MSAREARPQAGVCGQKIGVKPAHGVGWAVRQSPLGSVPAHGAGLAWQLAEETGLTGWETVTTARGEARLLLDRAGREYALTAGGACYLLQGITVDHFQGLLIALAVGRGPYAEEWQRAFRAWEERHGGWDNWTLRVITGGREPRQLPPGVDMHLGALELIPSRLRAVPRDTFTPTREQFATLWEQVVSCVVWDVGDYFRTVEASIDLTTEESRAFFQRGMQNYEYQHACS